MNVTSIFRDTANQLTTGVGKVINNIVDFFSNLSSGITGLFNSNTPFRQVSTGTESANSEFIIIRNEANGLKIDSNCFKNVFFENQYEMYNSIYNPEKNTYEEIDVPKDHEYDVINDDIFELIRGINKSANRNNSVNIENEYSEVVDSISGENIYSEPYSESSGENIYDTLPENY